MRVEAHRFPLTSDAKQNTPGMAEYVIGDSAVLCDHRVLDTEDIVDGKEEGLGRKRGLKTCRRGTGRAYLYSEGCFDR